MKRNDNLITLYKEHHHILLFAWKIFQGLKLGIQAGRIKAYVWYFWQNELQRHFEKEKSILFSTLDSKVTSTCIDDQTKIEF